MSSVLKRVVLGQSWVDRARSKDDGLHLLERPRERVGHDAKVREDLVANGPGEGSRRLYACALCSLVDRRKFLV